MAAFKIDNPRARPRPHERTEITVLDGRMLEILSCRPDVVKVSNEEEIQGMRLMVWTNPSLHRFHSGAILTVGPVKNSFAIIGYTSNGTDVKSAFEELKMLDYLRLAKVHFGKLKKECITTDLSALTLRVTNF